jgi:two-component system, cell cycle sensor histidine kinase and response regulator CckA
LLAEINRVKQALLKEVCHKVNENLQDIAKFPALPGRSRVDELEKSLKISQDHLQQAQKMEIVGTIAGGIAHDFNNLLQAIQGQVELLLLEKTQENPEYAELKQVKETTCRGTELVKQLLCFSRKTEGRKQPVQLNDVILQVEKLLKRVISKSIKIDLRLAPDLKTINADPVHLEQVLLNLAVNARDAMPTGGRLLLVTKNVVLGNETSRYAPALPIGEYVQLTVADTGCGMSEEVREHIFEPFFTTKEMAQGTGLGLAMVKLIIRNLIGDIDCSTASGEGTTFNIYLPARAQQFPLPRPKKEQASYREASGIKTAHQETSIQQFNKTVCSC